MSFHESAKDITLEDGHILKCILFNEEGEECEAELDLNYYLGNINGSFLSRPFDFLRTKVLPPPSINESQN